MTGIINKQYPIGKFKFPQRIDEESIKSWIHTLEEQPKKLKFICNRLSDEELKYQYRSGGWNIRQIIHHIADSHINSYVRYKWTLTEDTPMIKAYQEDSWATLPDYEAPVEMSLSLLEALHRRWTLLLHMLQPSDYERELIHPANNRHISLGSLTSMYAWHGNHHIAHVELALQEKIIE